ncbi:thymidylate kinase [Fibrobacterales bacterium]|nr:thymidylate kinase [Fibrobacterales bacterium]
MSSVYKNFFCLEGIDGSGKSTQISALEKFWTEKGIRVVKIREPGGTKIGEQIRSVLLDTEHKDKMSDIAELLLYNAARAQLIKEVIKPALESGCTVLADRFAYSTLAYQGYGRGLDIAMIKDLLKIACGDCFPTKTFILDIPVEVSRARQFADKERTGADRMEQEKNDFFERVRNGYRKIAEENKDNCTLIDATKNNAEIADLISELVYG